MSFGAWLFSAKLAWGRGWFRWMSITALVLPIVVGGLFIVNVLPSAKSHGSLIYHYNIYLGIDDVRDWGWTVFLPVIWLVLSILDIAVAYGMYRTDRHFSAALVSLALAWAFPWMGALFYLSILNL